MFDENRAFVTRAFLRAELGLEYRAYNDADDAVLLARLTAWSERLQLKETSAEGAFTQTFFVDTWGYGEAGRTEPENVTLYPKLRIPGEGAGGGMGEADVALGWFGDNSTAVPQVLCEFKDMRSDLDAPQSRKGNTRSPVIQCLNYVRGARRGMIGNEPVQPWWGLVTDMNEFRLYWWDRAPAQYLSFVIRRPQNLFSGALDLLTPTDDGRFDRFLFQKLFRRDELLSRGGRPPLLRLIERQWVRERALEGEFYDRYKEVRERLFGVLNLNNPDYPGTLTELLRLSQKLLDRFIFAFYCEDMGERMLFPPQLIRNFLRTRSTEPFYDPNGTDLWDFLKRLFGLMNAGGTLGGTKVPHINGGLFSPDPQIEGLILPNHVFAAPGQGANPAALERDRNTLLYLCASYNYAARSDVRESLSLYTLGRIFEQSITELEYRAGELEGRPSVASLSKRKRDGVYYTPEWVVNQLVEGTLGPWFAAAKAASGWPADEETPPDRDQVVAYEARLKRLRIVDPACGSGAFLISAFRRLLDERIALERHKARLDGGAVRAGVGDAALTSDILTNNIHGVDINPASVEITKLALWLHSARADAPLSSLDHTIRCGNSLVSPEFWVGRAPAPVAEREQVNAFDWRASFPAVWPAGEAGGFDIVLGNPPYVKLQNLKTVDPGVAAWIQGDRGDATFQSAQTGNMDLYLPFIEQGLRLLAPGGRMAYIAPSIWTVNQHGEGLRRLVRRTRQLDRWVDFKHHQIFEEAITYTALQFFTHEPNDAVKIGLAPDGDVADIDWADADLVVPYRYFAEDGEWLMATGAQRALIDRLAGTCLRLDDRRLTRGIMVGIQTSADQIYHLKRVGNDRYHCQPKTGAAYVVEIEDAIMKPVVSGPEAKRYEEPRTDTYLLFPYERTVAGAMRLISQTDLEARFHKAWAYLRSWETELRAREKRAFDDDTWWRFGRNQNIDKQEITKLIVAQTVPEMRVCADMVGDKYLNNVRVNGVLAANGVDPAYLMGVLNGPVADFVFRRIAKPKAGGYFEANKQFIAPLPIPNATPEDRAAVARLARELQTSWSNRRDLMESASERLAVLRRARHGADWLWPDLPSVADLQAQAPSAFRSEKERLEWALARRDEFVATKLEAVQASLASADQFEAMFDDGELSLYVDGAPMFRRIYLPDDEGRLARAYWHWLLLSQTWRDAKKFTDELRRTSIGAETPAATQFIAKVADLASEVSALGDREGALNDLLFDLYGLSDAERLLVKSQR